MSERLIRARALVSGIVQGVGFRAWVHRNATFFGLNGWVRNLSDGRVEVVVEGHEGPARNLMELLERGPAGSEVDKVDADFAEPLEGIRGFSIKPTGGT